MDEDIKIDGISLNDPYYKFLRAKALSEMFIGLAPSTFDNWAKQGLVTPIKIEGSKFYRLSEILQVIEISKVLV